MSAVGEPYRGSGPSRMQYVKMALKHYHEKGLVHAIDYVEDAFYRRGFRLEHLDRYIEYLYWYEHVLKSNPDWEMIVLRDKINYKIRNDLTLSGEVGRLDLASGGYNVWLFEESASQNWKNELRMPILQAYYAAEFGAHLNEVAVGVYSFSDEQ